MSMEFCIENPAKLIACAIKNGLRINVEQTSCSAQTIKDTFASLIKNKMSPIFFRFSDVIFKIDTGCEDCPFLSVHDRWEWDISKIISRANSLGLKGQEYYQLFPKLINEFDPQHSDKPECMKHSLVELSVSGCKTGETNAISDWAKENPWDFCWNMNELFGEEIIQYS